LVLITTGGWAKRTKGNYGEIILSGLGVVAPRLQEQAPDGPATVDASVGAGAAEGASVMTHVIG